MGIKGVHKVGKMKQKIRAKSYNNRFKRVQKKGRAWCTNRGKREQKQFTNSKGEKGDLKIPSVPYWRKTR